MVLYCRSFSFSFCVHYCLKNRFVCLMCIYLSASDCCRVFHGIYLPLIHSSSDASTYSYKHCSREYIKHVHLYIVCEFSPNTHIELYSWVIEMALPVKI